MNEANVIKSPCYGCEWCEYDTRYSPNGQAYRDYSCYYPRNWQYFGKRDSEMICADYTARDPGLEIV